MISLSPLAAAQPPSAVGWLVDTSQGNSLPAVASSFKDCSQQKSGLAEENLSQSIYCELSKSVLLMPIRDWLDSAFLQEGMTARHIDVGALRCFIM